MAIQTVGGIKEVLNKYDSKEWTKSANLENVKQKMFLKDAPLVPIEKGEIQESFGDFLKNSITKVNDLQVEANTAIQKLTTGETKNIHETMLAVESAELAFKTMNQIRTKVIDAYREVMKMQI